MSENNIPPTDESVKGRAFYRRFPNEVARDRRMSAESLVMVAYRATFASNKREFGLWEETLGGIVRGVEKDDGSLQRSGFGINVRRKAIADLIRLGYLKRPKNAKLPRTKDGHFRRAVDTLTLPFCEDGDGRVVKRDWFDGRFTIAELASLLFVRAGTGKGNQVYAREVAGRFGWSRPTAAEALASLCKRGLIDSTKSRKGDGTFSGVTYADTSLNPPTRPALLSMNRATASRAAARRAAVSRATDRRATVIRATYVTLPLTKG